MFLTPFFGKQKAKKCTPEVIEWVNKRLPTNAEAHEVRTFTPPPRPLQTSVFSLPISPHSLSFYSNYLHLKPR